MKKKVFPEGTMTEARWARKYAVSAEVVVVNWLDLIDRKRFNKMDGREQDEYEKELKAKAEKMNANPKYRVFRENGTYYVLSVDCVPSRLLTA